MSTRSCTTSAPGTGVAAQSVVGELVTDRRLVDADVARRPGAHRAPDPGIEALAHTKIASTISTVVADGYAVVLSTADIANSLLANAIGYPIAASVALVTPAAGANSSCWPADPSQHHRIAESRACA